MRRRLEMTLLGGTFAFPEGGVVALVGSDFGATIPLHTACELQPGEVLKTGPTKNGARCYLCVRGGIVVKQFLGSSSTHILSGLGGVEGRALRKGDVLQVGVDTSVDTARAAFQRRIDAPACATSARKILRTTVAPQTERFSAESLRLFYNSVYTVSEESNRMGLRLARPDSRDAAERAT